MKNFSLLFLGLALLGSGQAQTAPPTIPALPAPAAVSASGAPVALLLRAAPGTALEYAVTSRAQITDLQLNFVGKPGVKLSAAQSSRLAELNKTFGAQLPALRQSLGKNVSTSSKQFLRVLPSDAQGNAVLLTTLVTAPVSGGLDPAGQPLLPARTQTIKLTQTVAPDGQTLSIKVEADDPAVQRLYGAMKMEDLISNLSQTAQTNLYGLRLVPGQSRSVTQTTDLSALLGGVGEALGGAGARTQIKAQPLRAQPLTLNVATTFLGQNAAGLLNYQQHYSAEPLTLSASLGAAGGQTSVLNVKVTDWNGQGGLSYRADGLPQTSDTTQNVSVSMMADLPDMPVQMQVRMNLTLSVSSALR